MGKPHPMELRTRVADFVEEGNTHCATAARFRVSIKFVNDMVKLKRETGSLEPKALDKAGLSPLSILRPGMLPDQERKILLTQLFRVLGPHLLTAYQQQT